MSPESVAGLLKPLFILLLVVVGIRFLFQILLPELFYSLRNKLRFDKGARWRSDRELLYWLRGLRPSEFELYVVELFKDLGFSARHVGGSNDHGIDVTAEKDGVTHYIQCKKYFPRHQVGVAELRDFYGAIADHLTNGKAYFITTNKFTLEAEKFAEDKPIELVDSFELMKFIRLAKNKPKSNAPTQPVSSQCPECGGTLIEREGKFGKFFGCSNYPKCRHTAKQ
jgi:restriction system protein